MTAHLLAVLDVAWDVFAVVGIVVVGFAIVCVRDSQRMKRGTK